MARPSRGAHAPSTDTLTGLYFNYKYRFLTIAQFARIADFSINHAAEVLRGLEQGGIVGHFGFVSIPGHGKTPKVYYVKRRGWELLHSETNIPEDLSGPFSEVHKETTWTPQMYHRLRIIDVMISAEMAVRKRPHLTLARTFLSYRMIKKKGHVTRETTDYVDKEETGENKIVPDAAFILENIETKRKALFFVEMDMGTERIVSPVTKDRKNTLHFKISQYDRYLQSLRYTQTYAVYGEFRSFILLFATISEQRVENIRRELQNLPADLAGYYRFTTFGQAMDDFLGPIWKNRALADTRTYPLVRAAPATTG